MYQTSERVHACAANLCDLLAPEVRSLDSRQSQEKVAGLVEAVERQSGRTVTRVYAGSYFCDRYFCALGYEGIARVAEFARGRGLALTLVVPIFGQQTLTQGEATIARCLHDLVGAEGPLDEVCVNDYGEAAFVASLLSDGSDGPRDPGAPGGSGSPDIASDLAAPGARAVARVPRLVWGRLFARALRDPRYGAFSAEAQRVPYDAPHARELEREFGVGLLELDPFAPRVSLEDLQGELPIALHLPHSYVTTGHICELASVTRPVSRKFRPGSPCDCPCLRTLSVYETQDDGQQPLYFSKQGRTVYFENPNCELDDVAAIERIVWTPDDFGCPCALDAVETGWADAVAWPGAAASLWGTERESWEASSWGGSWESSPWGAWNEELPEGGAQWA